MTTPNPNPDPLLRGRAVEYAFGLAARNALTPDGGMLPAPPAVIAEAAEEVRQVANALLDPRRDTLTAPPADVETAASCRVEVTTTRYTLRPPCCPTAPIILARDVTEPLALNRLDCLACGLRYDVALLGSPDDGLWVCWREQKRPRP